MPARRFVAHAPHGRAHLMAEAESFVEAAVLYAERWHPTTADGEPLVAVTVIDASNGEQHCFAIDLDTGEAGPCETADEAGRTVHAGGSGFTAPLSRALCR